MAKKPATKPDTTAAETLEASPPLAMSIEQLIANRTGLGVGIVADLLAKLDAPGELLKIIETLTSDQILERIEPGPESHLTATTNPTRSTTNPTRKRGNGTQP